MNGSGVVFTPVSQSAVTGSGTSGSPYTVVTVVTAGPSLELTQTDTYVTGRRALPVDARGQEPRQRSADRPSIYRGMDCYLGGADNGYGYQDVASGGTGCSTNAEQQPARERRGPASHAWAGRASLRGPVGHHVDRDQDAVDAERKLPVRVAPRQRCRAPVAADPGGQRDADPDLHDAVLADRHGAPPPPGTPPSNTSPPTLSGPMHEGQRDHRERRHLERCRPLHLPVPALRDDRAGLVRGHRGCDQQ